VNHDKTQDGDWPACFNIRSGGKNPLEWHFHPARSSNSEVEAIRGEQRLIVFHWRVFTERIGWF
jgi:hypothetical protein